MNEVLRLPGSSSLCIQHPGRNACCRNDAALRQITIHENVQARRFPKRVHMLTLGFYGYHSELRLFEELWGYLRNSPHRFPKQGDPNINPNILLFQKVPLIGETPHMPRRSLRERPAPLLRCWTAQTKPDPKHRSRDAETCEL